ncbi:MULTISPECIES: hypothetical protein [unclassified Streptomyces]|uniref:hypothetical protein n=1 Tax=unclassified Streptomyces TaxID=2593676 RepID=UPI0033D84F68
MRVPSGRLCAGIVLGPVAGVVTLWLLALLGQTLYTSQSTFEVLLLPVSGIAVGCAVALTRMGTGTGYSLGLLAAIAAMFFCALHMESLSSNALHDRGREVYGVIQKETSSVTDPDGAGTTYSYAVSYPENLRQRELSTLNTRLEVGGRYLITVDPQRKVHPALGPRPGTDVFHLIGQIGSGALVLLFWTCSVMLGFRPDELEGW